MTSPTHLLWELSQLGDDDDDDDDVVRVFGFVNLVVLLLEFFYDYIFSMLGGWAVH